MKFILIAVFIIVGLFGLIYMHELVHVEINKSYGHESEILWFSHFPDVVTMSLPCPNDTCTLAHNINDAIGYHLQIFYSVFAMLFLILLIQMEGKEE